MKDGWIKHRVDDCDKNGNAGICKIGNTYTTYIVNGGSWSATFKNYTEFDVAAEAILREAKNAEPSSKRKR